MSLHAPLGAFTQESRLLEFTTLLGRNRLIAECMRGEEGVSQGFRSFELSEPTLPAVCEHILRFMEEGGPHLPPGEALADEAPPVTLWQSMGTVGPFGPRYMIWWREHKVSMPLFHLLAPVTVPMFVLWGFLNWLSYCTAIKVEWPPEVLSAIQS